MASSYYDVNSVIQVIGAVYNNPSLLKMDDKYILTDEDFDNNFHRVIFGAIYKLVDSGVNEISLNTIDDFLSTRPKSYELYQKEKGPDWILQISDICNTASFDYYYNRLKKMTLLRAYDKFGVDVSDLYDTENILDIKKKERQEEWLDNTTLEEIANKIDLKIEQIKLKYVNDVTNDTQQAGTGIFELIERFKEYPEVGTPMYGDFINSVTRGARLGKFYLRSAPTGVGKTRTMVADACYIGCNEYYDENYGWIRNGNKNASLYITTEQDLSEIQTMMLAFIANVNEDHILDGKYEGDEEDRVLKAAKIISESPIYIEELPDFSLQDVENTIKKAIRDYDVAYVFYDYIHTSIKILEEITRRSGGVKLREDNILFMLSTRLKDICKKYDIFILSSTQLNGDYQEAKTPDQNLLRGAKSIADKIDMGAILLPVKDTDLKALEPVFETGIFETPTIKLSVYKNRRSKYKGILLWCKADLGCCKVKPMFCTTYGYELININNLKIEVEEDSAF